MKMKNLIWKNSSGVAIITIAILMFSPYSLASPSDPGKPILTNVQNIVQKIESSKMVDIDAEALDKLLDNYVGRMEQELLAAKSDKAKLRTLQAAAKEHEALLKNLERKVKSIEIRLKSGDIRLSKVMLQKMKQAEINEFKNFLEPKALKIYQQLHPDIFKPGTTAPVKQMKHGASVEIGRGISCAQSSLPFLEELFATPAYASEFCDKCRGSYNSCYNGCCGCKWYKPWCCLCKLACVVVYSGCLAICEVAEPPSAGAEQPKPGKLPDLVIKDWWVTPDARPGNSTNEVQPGQSYQACFIVENIGSADSGPFTVGGGGLGISHNPTQNHASLSPGQRREGCLQYPTTPSPGRYNLEIKADVHNTVAESNENNNTRVESITVLPPKKLEKEAEHVGEPTRALEGKKIGGKIKKEDERPQPTPPTKLRKEAEHVAEPTGALEGKKIGGRESAKKEKLPDLKVVHTDHQPAGGVLGGKTILFKVTVKNVGSGVAHGTVKPDGSTTPDGYMIDLSLSKKAIKDPVKPHVAPSPYHFTEGMLLKEGRISRTEDLAPGASKEYSASVEIPKASPGRYWIGVSLDPFNKVEEGSPTGESDNAANHGIMIK